MSDTATVMARLNTALYDTVTRRRGAESGTGTMPRSTFTTPCTPTNAVQVTVSHGTNKLIMGALGIAAPRIKATATAWANAPVNNTNCMKPWTMPYTILMDLVNRKRVADGSLTGDPDSYANLTRDFTDEDRDILSTMSDAERTFTLKMGSSGLNDPPPGSTMPGNFQAVMLPRAQSADGTVNPDGPPQNGATGYEDAIEGLKCYTIGVGDILDTKPGNMVGPTLNAVEKQNAGDQNYICADIVTANGATHGDCVNDQGGVGVDIKTAFHQCLSGCNGASQVTVRMVGSFTLTKIYPDNGNANKGENWDKGQIQGIFKPLAATGPVGPGPTTLQRIILVR